MKKLPPLVASCDDRHGEQSSADEKQARKKGKRSKTLSTVMAETRMKKKTLVEVPAETENGR
jgi:hypothetical protein